MVFDILGTEKLTIHKIVFFSRSYNTLSALLAARTKESKKENVNLRMMLKRYGVRKEGEL
jgi:hypothetical protein